MFWIVATHLPALALLLLGYPSAALGAVFIAHMLTLAGTLIPGAQIFCRVRKTFHPAGGVQEVWLTFDDGPDPQTTPAVLELLAQHDAKATFFLIGENARQHPELVHAITRAGHTIGNHTQTHPAYQFWRLQPGALEREISRCQETLTNITGEEPAIFRAPAGMKNPFVPAVLKRHQLELIGWTARGFDGVETDGNLILDRIMAKTRTGGILLLHEGRPTTIDTAGRLLSWLGEKGFRCVLPDTP